MFLSNTTIGQYEPNLHGGSGPGLVPILNYIVYLQTGQKLFLVEGGAAITTIWKFLNSQKCRINNIFYLNTM